MRLPRLLLLVLLAGGLPGCGPPAATISGHVTVDGQPLKGVISYSPADGAGAPLTVDIVNGKYQLQTTAGKKLVQISEPVVIDRRKESDAPDAAMVDITDERLPERYHTKTELTFEVKPGPNTKDWSLESK